MLDFNRFEILTFDCYGTLIDWETGLLSALHRILSAHGKKIDDGTLLELYGNFELLSEQGVFHPYREVLQSVVQQFGTELGFVPSADEICSLPDSLAGWKPWPDTVAALRQLKSRYRLAIVSNVDDDLFAATRPQLEVEFDEVITAQQAQAYKPSMKIFELGSDQNPGSGSPHSPRRPKRLPRCDSGSSPRPGDGLGQPSFRPSRCGRGQGRPRRA